jgi:HAMP domain-containing protein
VRVAVAAVQALAIVAVLLLVAPLARATPSEDLERARQSFRAGDFQTALPLLSFLLYPTPRLARSDDLLEAHVLLGACGFETGDRAIARREFEQALYLSVDSSLDPQLFSTEAVRFFEDTRTALEERTRRNAEKSALAEERERLLKYRESLIVYEVRPFYVNFVPFGAGQFQNGERTKGLLFSTAQALTFAASAGIWVYLTSQYGYNGRVPPEDAENVRLMQQLEIGAGIAFWSIYSWSVVDSLLHYKPRAQVQGDDSLLPEELRDLDSAKKAKSEKAKARSKKTPSPRSWLGPAPAPGGLILGLGGEF